MSSPEAGCAIGRAHAQKECMRTQWSVNSGQLICSRPASSCPPDLGPEGSINWQCGLAFELHSLQPCTPALCSPRPHFHVKGPHGVWQQRLFFSHRAQSLTLRESSPCLNHISLLWGWASTVALLCVFF